MSILTNFLIANLSDLHSSVIEGFKVTIKGGVINKDISKAFPIKRTLPHVHIACILQLVKKLKFIWPPFSKLGITHLLSKQTATTSISIDQKRCFQ